MVFDRSTYRAQTRSVNTTRRKRRATHKLLRRFSVFGNYFGGKRPGRGSARFSAVALFAAAGGGAGSAAEAGAGLGVGIGASGSVVATVLSVMRVSSSASALAGSISPQPT